MDLPATLYIARITQTYKKKDLFWDSSYCSLKTYFDLPRASLFKIFMSICRKSCELYWLFFREKSKYGSTRT